MTSLLVLVRSLLPRDQKSLSTLLQSSSPFRSDFMPVYQSITGDLEPL